MTKDELAQCYDAGHAAINRLYVALEQAWAERYDALAELQRMKDRPCEQEFSRVDRMWNSLVAERDEALKELATWRSGGLTEELLRKGDGYIKAGRGCLIISEHYLVEKDAEITALRSERDDALKGRAFLLMQNYELIEDVAAVGSTLKAKVEELEEQVETFKLGCRGFP